MSEMTLVSLLAGLVLCLPFLAWARSRRRVYARGLLLAALLYVIFAAWAPRPLPWLLIELCGVALFGVFAWLGIRRSPWWLVLGWLVHPLWDVLLHAGGEGAMHTPTGYAAACISFDLLVAAVLAVRLKTGRLRGVTPLKPQESPQ